MRRIKTDESVECNPHPPVRLHDVLLRHKDIIILRLQGKSHNVIFEISTAVNMKMTVFWDVSPYNFVDKYRRFGRNVPPSKLETEKFLFMHFRNVLCRRWCWLTPLEVRFEYQVYLERSLALGEHTCWWDCTRYADHWNETWDLAGREGWVSG